MYSGGFDEGAGLLGYNTFVYCANNPVKYKDATGESITLACIIGFAIVGALAGGYAGYKLAQYYNVEPGQRWKYVLGGIVIGGASGALLGWGVGAAATAYAAKTASVALFSGKIASSGTMVIQLLKKYYEKPKAPMDLKQLKQLITLCQRYGLEIHASFNDLVTVVNHKSWNGIPHIHIDSARIHVPLTPEAVDYIRKILGF